MNPKLIPYINNLSLEADIPLELAKVVFAACSIFSPLMRTAFEKIDRQELLLPKHLLVEGFVEMFSELGNYMKISQPKMESALRLALELVDLAQEDSSVLGIDLKTGECHGS